MKFEPRSHLILTTGPRIERNRWSAQTNALVSIDSRTSMWTALLFRQVNTSPQRLELRAPPLSSVPCLDDPGSKHVQTDVGERRWGFGSIGG